MLARLSFLLLAVIPCASAFFQATLQPGLRRRSSMSSAHHYADKPEQQLTLVFVRREHEGRKQILLGRKRRGFGEGRWNGFGGKVEAGEAIDDAAKRELLEECSITAQSLVKKGKLTFTLNSYEHIMKVRVYEAIAWTGEPRESEEMTPQWYDEAELPFDLMWADDSYWMPLFLAGKHFEGVFHFSDDETIVQHTLQTLDASQVG